MRLPNATLRDMRLQREAGVELRDVVVRVKPRRRNLESEMQRALIRWWAGVCKGFGISEFLLFSVPNGFNADAKRGSIMKAEGQRKGVPDLVLCVGHYRYKPARDAQGFRTLENDNCHGLFLELKTPAGVLPLDQQLFHEALKAQGYKVVVVRSLEEGIATITEYLTV